MGMAGSSFALQLGVLRLCLVLLFECGFRLPYVDDHSLLVHSKQTVVFETELICRDKPIIDWLNQQVRCSGRDSV